MELIKAACREFINDRISCITSFGDGRINDTFRIKTDKAEYICQKIRRAVNSEILERNYILYAEACGKTDLLYPKWLKTETGKFFYTDEYGDHWRMYPMIEGQVLSIPVSEELLIACGEGLARMHVMLQTFSEKPRATYPMHHDLKHYYERYLWVLNNDLSGESRDDELEDLIDSGLEAFIDLKIDRSAVIHGDPKLANILFVSGKVKAFLDLDTLMQGALAEDIADCIRSCCIREGKIDKASVQAFMQGYQRDGNVLLSKEETELLPFIIRKICFELGLRYYTDAIAKEKKFKEKYPGYLMEKARFNFAAL